MKQYRLIAQIAHSSKSISFILLMLPAVYYGQPWNFSPPLLGLQAIYPADIYSEQGYDNPVTQSLPYYSLCNTNGTIDPFYLFEFCADRFNQPNGAMTIPRIPGDLELNASSLKSLLNFTPQSFNPPSSGTSFSVSFWMKIPEEYSDSSHQIPSLYLNNSIPIIRNYFDGNSYTYEIDQSNLANSNLVQVCLPALTPPNSALLENVNWTDWNHVVLNFNGNQCQVQFEVYFNNTLFFFESNFFSYYLGPGLSFMLDLGEANMSIDDLIVYNRPLVAAEINQLYEAPNSLINENNSSTTTPSPPGIPYQAEVRNESGEVLANANVNVRFTLHELTANGTVSYQETHAVNTNELGLFAATIGAGTATQGTFAGINWAQTTKFLQVEVDTSNGYITMGNQQLMSVPYALYAANSQPGPQGAAGPQGPAGVDGTQGEQGNPGVNGFNSLINTSQELPGNNCQNGGIKIETGLDINSNGILETTEIATNSTKYICNEVNPNNTVINPPGFGQFVNPNLPILGASSGCMTYGTVGDEYVLDASKDGNSGYWVLYRNADSYKIAQLDSLGRITRKWQIGLPSGLIASSIQSFFVEPENNRIIFYGNGIFTYTFNGVFETAYQYTSTVPGTNYPSSFDKIVKSGTDYLAITTREIIRFNSSFQITSQTKLNWTITTDPGGQLLDLMSSADGSIYFLSLSSDISGSYCYLTKMNSTLAHLWSRRLGLIGASTDCALLEKQDGSIAVSMCRPDGNIHYSIFSSVGNTLLQRRINNPSFSGATLGDISMETSLENQITISGSIANSANFFREGFIVLLNSSNSISSSFITQSDYTGTGYYTKFRKNFTTGNKAILIGETNTSGLGAADIFVSKINLTSGSCCIVNSTSTISTDTGINSVTPTFISAGFTRTTLTGGYSQPCDLFINSICFE